MTAVLPRTLFRAKRGLCPACGAPLSLDRDDAQTACGFCGQTAVLERRLRKVEPELPDAPLRLFIDGESADAGRVESSRWVRSKQYREGIVGSANCPGCGDALDYTADDSAITCRTCGTDCRLEQRLWAQPPDPSTEQPRQRHPSERNTGDREDADHPESEHLAWRILHEPNADRRLALALNLGHHGFWSHINATTARLLPTLLAAVNDAEPALQRAVADALGKLLCEGSRSLRNAAVHAAERVIFDTRCPRTVLFHLGLGDGVCVKPLLDAAEFAIRRGDFEYACWCLHGVNLVFQRNYDQHDLLGQVLLYRMLYLTGPVLAFALLLAQRQFGIGFHYQAETLLAFMDDAAVERPGLLAELDKSFYVGWPKDDGEFKGRFATYRALKTDASRQSALRHFISLPENATDAQWEAFFAFVLPIWDADGPLKEAAGECLLSAISHTYPTPDVIHRLVERRGRTLPIEVQRSYLTQHRDTPHLSFNDLPYWESKPTPELSKEMSEALAAWKTGIRDAVDADEALRDEMKVRFDAVKLLEAPIFE